jgi:hypothetical protein
MRTMTISLKEENKRTFDCRSCFQIWYTIKPVVIAFWAKASAYIVFIQRTKEGEKIESRLSWANWRKTIKFAAEAAVLDQEKLASDERINVLTPMMSMAMGKITIGRLLSHIV